ncbi:hypothetical protein ACFVAJ_19260 [Agromyces sp. NPDC057679]|uniref:hypothetical protein n=1 Tax=Agromyces sp. NPDC057679 TaxID=3346207 RepID=UPI00366E811D
MLHLDYPAAETVKTYLSSLTENDRATISANSLATIDYRYWLRKSKEAAIAADPAAAAFLATLDDDPGLNGPVIAALVEPIIGRGVHRAQLWLLTGGYDGHLEQAQAA